MPSKVPAHGNRSVNRSPCFPHRWCWDHEPSLLRRCLSRVGFRRHLVLSGRRLGRAKCFHPTLELTPPWQSAVEMTLAGQGVTGEQGTESASRPEQSEECPQRPGRHSAWTKASGVSGPRGCPLASRGWGTPALAPSCSHGSGPGCPRPLPAPLGHSAPPPPPRPGMHRPCSPARRTGPLSVLPPKPNLSQKGGAQWASQWQFFRLLHTCRGHREEDAQGEAALEPTLRVGGRKALSPNCSHTKAKALWPESPWSNDRARCRNATVSVNPKRSTAQARPEPGAANVT